MEAHHALSEQGVKKWQGLSDAELTAGLGPYLELRLKVLLSGTMEAVDESLASFKNQFSSLRALGNRVRRRPTTRELPSSCGKRNDTSSVAWA
jgi:hypothetical protein